MNELRGCHAFIRLLHPDSNRMIEIRLDNVGVFVRQTNDVAFHCIDGRQEVASSGPEVIDLSGAMVSFTEFDHPSMSEEAVTAIRSKMDDDMRRIMLDGVWTNPKEIEDRKSGKTEDWGSM